jgi:hypothetical protein
MRHDIRTEIDIEAPPEEVWPHLVDLTAYADWNPFITSATGSAEEGRRLSLRMEPPGGRAATVHPRVTQVSTAAALEWLGHLVVPGLFDVRHRFELVPAGSGSHLVQRESFRGLLVRPLRRSLDGGTRAGFEAMNAALRRRVREAHSAA